MEVSTSAKALPIVSSSKRAHSPCTKVARTDLGLRERCADRHRQKRTRRCRPWLLISQTSAGQYRSLVDAQRGLTVIAAEGQTRCSYLLFIPPVSKGTV